MRVEALKSNRVEEFIVYCRKHRADVDDSFLYDEDLREFEPNADNPTYIAVDDNKQIIAAASLIINEYHRIGKKGRFRIFHSEVLEVQVYDKLLQAILKHTEGLDKIFVFMHTDDSAAREIIEELKFTVERYSFFLVREDLEVQACKLPEEYEIMLFKEGVHEKAWCEVRNSAFAKLKGSETPITEDMVSKMIADNDSIEGATILLYHKERPVGVGRGALDEYEGLQTMNIGPIAIIPEYQGKGLGRYLLRTILSFARNNNFRRTTLCVNAENEKAKDLYLQEGFKQAEAVVCYKYDIIKDSSNLYFWDAANIWFV
jgi:mycothiol synthase